MSLTRRDQWRLGEALGRARKRAVPDLKPGVDWASTYVCEELARQAAAGGRAFDPGVFLWRAGVPGYPPPAPGGPFQRLPTNDRHHVTDGEETP